MIKKSLLFLFLVLIVYVLYIFSSTGFFRTIENQSEFKIARKIELPGAEDMAVSYVDSFIIISSDDRASRRDGKPKQGGLYFASLKDNDFKPRLLTGNFKEAFFPHGIGIFQLDSARYKIYAINHVDGLHSIEVFVLNGADLTHQETLTDKLIFSPNDIVPVNENQFYFTNDHGYGPGIGMLAEDYLGLAVSDVIFFDGKEYRQVAKNIAYANGINYDEKRKLLYVASPRGFKIHVYKVLENHNLIAADEINCGTGIDNIELDEQGELWGGCHPSLLGFAAYAKGRNEIAPSELIRVKYNGKGDYEVHSFFLDDGKQMSAASVARPFGNRIFAGNVMDQHFLILEK